MPPNPNAGNPLTPSFWDQELKNLTNSMHSLLVDTYYSGAQGGVEALPDEVKSFISWDYVNQAAVDFAKAYTPNIKGIMETTATQTKQAIADWIQSGAPLSELDKTLSPIYGDTRASMIASTEVTRVFAQGNMDAWDSTGVVEGATWMTAEDELVCPVCGDLDGTEVGLGDTDGAPPAHPNCRCYLQPVVSDDLVQQKIDEAINGN